MRRPKISIFCGRTALGAALAVAILPGAAIAQSQGAIPLAAATAEADYSREQLPKARIEVSGQGRVPAVPDMAVLSLGVAAMAETPGEAVDAMSRDLAKVLDSLIEAGVAARDVQTGQLLLQPHYDDRVRPEPGTPVAPEVTGYEALSDLTVRIRDLDALGGILDAAVGIGANRFSGLNFQLGNPQEAQDAARKAAVEDAIRKAHLLAEAAGLDVGPLLLLTEGGISGGPLPMMRETMQAADVPVAPGEIETTAEVRMIFALVEAQDGEPD